MTDLVERALAHWGFEDAQYTFVAGRENQVYRVHSAHGDFALRIKRQGYRSEAELQSELLWLDAMDQAGLWVPRPRPALNGQLLVQVGGHYVDMVGWLTGKPMGQGQAPLDLEDAPGAIRRLGAEMARLHIACDSWDRPPGFVRCSWDADGLLGDVPLWGRFWENPTLDADTRDLLVRFRVRARTVLGECAKDLDYGLIHADLLRENVLSDGAEIRMLDFDDGGFGFRLFDIATALLRNMDEPDYDDLKAALIAGYRAERPLDIRHLDLFLALRAVTYVGWITPRMAEDGAIDRNTRFIKRAGRLCASWLRPRS